MEPTSPSLPTPEEPHSAPIKLTLDAMFVAPNALLGVQTESLTLQQALVAALENNAVIKARRLNPEIGNAQVQASLGRFDPSLSYTWRYLYTNTPQNAAQFISTGGTVTQAQVTLIEQLEEILAILRGQQRQQNNRPNQQVLREPNMYDSQNIFNRLSLGGILPTGTSYEFFLSYDQLRNETNVRGLPALFYPEYSGSAGFRITQPLLRNFGPAATMAATRIARLDRRTGWLEWRAEVERVLAETAAAYYDLALAQENLRVRIDNIHLAQRLAHENRRRVLHGRMSEFQVLEAQSAVQNRQDEYFAAASDLASRMAQLRSLISSATQSTQWTELTAADPLDYTPLPLDRDALYNAAMSANSQIQLARLAVQRGDIIVRFRRNQALPDLSIQTGVSGLATSPSYADAVNDAFAGQGLDFNVGVVVSIPLGNIEGRAQLAAAKFDRQRAEYLLQNVRITIGAEVDALCSRVLLTRERVQSARKAVALADQTLQSANRLLEEGRTTSFDVLRLQNSLALARAQLNAAIADHAKAQIFLKQRTGTLPEFFGFQLEREAWRDIPATRPRVRNFNDARKNLRM